MDTHVHHFQYKRNIPNLQLWDFSKGLKDEFETAVVNEPSEFKPLKIYCIIRCISNQNITWSVGRCSKTSGFGFSTSPSGPGESKVHAKKPMSDPYIIIVFFTIYVFGFADKSSGDFNIYINRFQRAALTIKRTYREVDGGKMFHPLVTGTVK